ncbi:MAG: ATP-binding protein [Thermoleophilaceae bacterium]
MQVRVDDCGARLPEERHDVPIDALWPARPNGRGLLIARTIVEAHGGALGATALPRGSSVRFYLPTTARAGA